MLMPTRVTSKNTTTKVVSLSARSKHTPPIVASSSEKVRVTLVLKCRDTKLVPRDEAKSAIPTMSVLM